MKGKENMSEFIIEKANEKYIYQKPFLWVVAKTEIYQKILMYTFNVMSSYSKVQKKRNPIGFEGEHFAVFFEESEDSHCPVRCEVINANLITMEEFKAYISKKINDCYQLKHCYLIPRQYLRIYSNERFHIKYYELTMNEEEISYELDMRDSKILYDKISLKDFVNRIVEDAVSTRKREIKKLLEDIEQFQNEVNNWEPED